MEVVAENYQLKWHSYSSYLHSYVSVALQNDSFADVALITLDGHQVMAHRFILSANSQYFHQVFKLQPKVTTTLPIMIILPSEISYKTLLILLQYMYSGEATVSNDVLENVLRGGDILKVKGLYRPKEDEQFDKKGVKVSHKTNNSIPTPKNEKKSTKSATTQNQQKVLNYTFNVKKFNNDNSVSNEESQDKSKNQIQVNKDRSKNISETRELAKKSEGDKSNNEDESSKSNETMQILVIKEEPIEWTEVEGEMELVDEKEVFNAELSIKPEVYMEDSNPAPSEEMYSPLTCELCTETFTIPAEWVRHVQTHTDMLPAKRQRRDRPSKDDENATFPALHCDMCQKFFPTPAEWVHHIQDTHTEFELHLSNKKVPKEVPQTDNTKQVRQMSDVHKICSDCNKVFPSHASMLIHKRTHTGEKPYSCEFCYKGFNVKSNLLRHLRTLHNKIINPTDVEDSTGE